MSKAKESAGGSQKLRLLLVSDNAEDFTYLQDLLGRAADRRVDARHAASPTQAIRELENNTCDLLLCNYRSGDPWHCSFRAPSASEEATRLWSLSAIT